MGDKLHCALVGLVLSICGFSVADACGDKPGALGGGVSFGHVFNSRHPGKLVLFIKPDSQLRAANAELRLDSALARAGHTVRTVSTRGELEESLQAGAADLVVADWVDARKLDSEIGGRVAILPVMTDTEKAAGAEALAASGCLVDVHSHKGRQVVRAVDQALERHGKGLPVSCGKPPAAAAG
jgi:hypothetical protein